MKMMNDVLAIVTQENDSLPPFDQVGLEEEIMELINNPDTTESQIAEAAAECLSIINCIDIVSFYKSQYQWSSESEIYSEELEKATEKDVKEIMETKQKKILGFFSLTFKRLGNAITNQRGRAEKLIERYKENGNKLNPDASSGVLITNPKDTEALVAKLIKDIETLEKSRIKYMNDVNSLFSSGSNAERTELSKQLTADHKEFFKYLKDLKDEYLHSKKFGDRRVVSVKEYGQDRLVKTIERISQGKGSLSDCRQYLNKRISNFNTSVVLPWALKVLAYIGTIIGAYFTGAAIGGAVKSFGAAVGLSALAGTGIGMSFVGLAKLIDHVATGTSLKGTFERHGRIAIALAYQGHTMMFHLTKRLIDIVEQVEVDCMKLMVKGLK